MSKESVLKKRNQRGFTLVELIIAIAISSVVILAIGTVMISINKTATIQYDNSQKRSDIRNVATYLTNDIRYSQSVRLVSQQEMFVTDKEGNEIRYFIKNNNGTKYLARQADGLMLYDKIENVKFSLENDELVSVDLITGTEDLKNLRISRWNDSVEDVPQGGLNFSNIFIYGSSYIFGGNRVEAPNGAIYINGNLNGSDLNGGSYTNIKTIYIKGNIDINNGSAGMGLSEKALGDVYVSGNFYLRSGTRKIYANVHVGGNAIIKDAVIYGDIYVNGNLTLDWTPEFRGKAYYTGQLLGPTELIKRFQDKCIKVNSVEPFDLNYNLPELRPESWYTQHNYQSGKPLADNVRIYSKSSYSYTLNNVSPDNVVVVSKGDITISGNWTKVSGVLFAPYGNVTLNGISSFEGIIIAKNVVTYNQGGSTLKYRDISEFFASKDDYPFK